MAKVIRYNGLPAFEGSYLDCLSYYNKISVGIQQSYCILPDEEPPQEPIPYYQFNRIMAQLNKLKAVQDFVEYYNSPWGAAKAESWRDKFGTKITLMQPEIAVQYIAKLLGVKGP